MITPTSLLQFKISLRWAHIMFYENSTEVRRKLDHQMTTVQWHWNSSNVLTRNGQHGIPVLSVANSWRSFQMQWDSRILYRFWYERLIWLIWLEQFKKNGVDFVFALPISCSILSLCSLDLHRDAGIEFKSILVLTIDKLMIWCLNSMSV